jgi:glycosyltransferase involved in cell wall biosynthesis
MSETVSDRPVELPEPSRQDQGLRVAYLLKRYPRLSETFILHEMLALEARGMRLHVYALLDPAEATVHPDVDRLAAPVTYLPRTTPAHLGHLARAHARLLRRDPRRYLGALRLALTRPNPLVGLRHLVRAGWLGIALECQGIRHLHAHFAHGPAATAQFVHALTGLPYSFTAHAKDIYTTPPALLAQRIRETCFVVTCTGYNADYLASLVDTSTATRIHRIYHGVDVRRFRLLPPLAQDPPLILAVGRLVEKKGLSYLVEACALLRARGVSFRCLMVGAGPLKDQLRAQIASLGLEGAVALLGARTQEELVDIYRQATLLALPCVVLENGDRDGIPNVLVEAMSLGLPVVSTRISGIPELVDHGRNGLLVPPRDAPALAAALAALLADPAQRRSLGAEAHRTIAERFDLAQNAARLEALFASVLGRGEAAPIAAASALEPMAT